MNKHKNNLAGETSPYLLQHVYNPVDWYPWSDEALQRAKRENKPILLSIGYSACHWCHVMERESFEDDAIAKLMNDNFINIKVDREERPDLDQIYMNAVQMMTGHGGWPLTVFLTPDLLPFYGGTYFPPEDRHRMPGFPRVLQALAEAYRERPGEVQQAAYSLLAELRRMNNVQSSSEHLSVELLDAAFQGLTRAYDRTHGGFGKAPKFPAPMSLEFALCTYYRSRAPEALEMVTHTCHRMAEGGMYDQLGGGFHRYSTDAEWLVPHFEKMLYDNALLSRLYLHVYQATGEAFYRRIVEETLDYVLREMTDDQGGFYSTQDADSEGEEGKFFVWTAEEINQLLGDEDATLAGAYFGVTETGNFEGKNILHVNRPVEQVARQAGVSVERLQPAIERAKRLLLEVRERRVKPGRDEKILTAWNGLMLTSFAEAAVVLNRADYRKAADRNAEFLLNHLRQNGLMLRSYKDGQARFNGYLDDYAYTASGLLALYEATGRLRHLEEALNITDRMIDEFWDMEAGGFFYTGKSHEQLIVRTKDYFDNATPSGNSVAADLLLRLAALTEKEDYRRKAVTIFRLIREQMSRYPSAFGYALGALDFDLSTKVEIAIIGNRDAIDTNALVHETWRPYLPNRIVAQAAEEDERAKEIVPLLRDRWMMEGKATAYVCENYSCRQLVTTLTELSEELEAVKAHR